jgi:hypothetical protein
MRSPIFNPPTDVARFRVPENQRNVCLSARRQRGVSAMTRSFRQSILAVALGTLLTGCLTASPEQQAKRNEERCANRGYKPGTPDFQDCVVRIEGERTQRMESNRREMMERPGGPGTPRGY